MTKHVGSLDVRKDLRVRGRVEEKLSVRKEVEASAFYVRGQGELIPSEAFFPVIKTARSNVTNVELLEEQTAVSLTVPATGTYHISVQGAIRFSHEITAGATDSQVEARLEENIDSLGWKSVASDTVGNTAIGGGGDDARDFQSAAVLFYDFGGPTNGLIHSYRLSATLTGTSGEEAVLNAGGLQFHHIRARLDRVG